MDSPGKHFCDFGPFRLDAPGRMLLREGRLVPLTPKVFETLLLLVQRRGQIVDRGELIKTVWPDSHVGEGSLNSNIFALRKALGDEDGLRYIATVPRRGYRFVASVHEITEAKLAVNSPTVRSMAVLPFKLLGADSRDAYLGMGIADALITQLSNLRQVVLRPTSAVCKYINPEQDPTAAGRELGVELVLEGSIRRSGERLRLTVQLVSVADGVPLWAEKFDEASTDIFALEDAISARIVTALGAQLLGTLP